jgi:hypothetical protein
LAKRVIVKYMTPSCWLLRLHKRGQVGQLLKVQPLEIVMDVEVITDGVIKGLSHEVVIG